MSERFGRLTTTPYDMNKFGGTGNSDLYIGDGEAPPEAKVQINPNGKAVNLDQLIADKLANIDPSEIGAAPAFEIGNGLDLKDGVLSATATGGGEVCDLLIDVTTTERVSQVKQDIDNIAYKYIVVVGENIAGHADNNGNKYTFDVVLKNKLNQIINYGTQPFIFTDATISYTKILAQLTDKFGAFQSYKNVSSLNNTNGQAFGMFGVYEWDSNVLTNITVGCNTYNTMKTGASIKVWGVRA